MRIKKILTLTLSVLTVLAILSGCQFSEDNPFESSVVSSDTSTESSQTEISGTSGASEISLFPDESSEPEKKEDTVLHVVACGDNLIHPSVYYYAMELYAEEHGIECTYNATNDDIYDFLPIYENVADVLEEADICFINQETLSGGEGTEVYGYPRFNSPLAVGQTIKALGVDVVNMAHNHMLDAGNDSFLIYSNSYFKSLGMTPIGYYANETDTYNIVYTENEGVRIAWLAYTYGTNGNGTGYGSETYIPLFDEDLIKRQVALAKQEADVIIVSAHWGNEYSLKYTSTQQQYAELFCELGVDVVIGTHSHCLEPMEWMTSSTGHKMLLTYSLGNFLSGMQEAECVLEGMLSFDIRVSEETGVTIENVVLDPLVLHYTKEKIVSKLDTGYRNFKIYYLRDYTEELASVHGVLRYEKSHGTTLYGGGFSIENLYKTVQTVIPAEFLPSDYRAS